MSCLKPRRLAVAMAALMAGALLPSPAAPAEALPWMNKALQPERRAELLIKGMTLDQKMQQMVGGPGQVLLQLGQRVLHVRKQTHPDGRAARSMGFPRLRAIGFFCDAQCGADEG